LCRIVTDTGALSWLKPARGDITGVGSYPRPEGLDPKRDDASRLWAGQYSTEGLLFSWGEAHTGSWGSIAHTKLLLLCGPCLRGRDDEGLRCGRLGSWEVPQERQGQKEASDHSALA